MGETRLIPIDVGLAPISQEVHVSFVQLATRLDQAKRITAPATHTERLLDALGRISDKDTFTGIHVILVPEASVPVSSCGELLKCMDGPRRDRILIAGLEIAPASELTELVRTLSLRDSAAATWLGAAPRDQLFNATLVAVFGRGGTDHFVQLKTAPSKFEGSDNVDNLGTGDYIYYFSSDCLSFVVLTCSDLFGRPPGARLRVIDLVDYEILKRGRTIDFLFNIQFNPSPDHDLFLHSIRRLYDDGYGPAGQMCTVLLNASLENAKGGRSKLLFFREQNLQPLEPVKQLDVPTVGYEIGQSETLLTAHFDRRVSAWDPKREHFPVHFDIQQYADTKWTRRSFEGAARYIAPMEPRSSLSTENHLQLAQRLSDLGEYAEALDWVRRSLEQAKLKKQYLRAAQAAHFIAAQHRHEGHYRDALAAYAEAEQHLQRVEARNGDAKLLEWRIFAGRLMITEYLTKGLCGVAREAYMRLVGEMHDYVQTHQELDPTVKRKVELYALHADRQCAEMLRLLGKYRRARSLFSTVYKQYSYVHDNEKAYSALGEGDALRMQARVGDAAPRYEEVRGFAAARDNPRLAFRVIRSTLELGLQNGNASDQLMPRMRELEGRMQYRMASIYLALTEGQIALMREPMAARNHFETAMRLSADESLGVADLEKTHATFGLAEASRIIGDRDAKTSYREALTSYRKMGVIWGIVRTAAGCGICGELAEVAALKRAAVESADDWALVEQVRQPSAEFRGVLFNNVP